MFEQYATHGGFMPPPYQMYPGALNTAGINATVTAHTQKVLDALAADKIDRQAQRINQLAWCVTPPPSPTTQAATPSVPVIPAAVAVATLTLLCILNK